MYRYIYKGSRYIRCIGYCLYGLGLFVCFMGIYIRIGSLVLGSYLCFSSVSKVTVKTLR